MTVLVFLCIFNFIRLAFIGNPFGDLCRCLWKMGSFDSELALSEARL